MSPTGGGGEFDPRAILAALEEERAFFVVIGALARVLQGADEVTSGVDICPSVRPENLAKIDRALERLGVGESIAERVAQEPVVRVETAYGELKVIGEPAGTRKGYDDLRFRANREPIGGGVRPEVASPADLVRMLAALDRTQDIERLQSMQRVIELGRGRSRGIEL